MGVIEINRRPSRRDLRWFGFILPVFFGIVGVVLRFRLGLPSAAVPVWGAGVLVTSAYVAFPPIRTPVYVGWMHLFFPLGWTVSHLVLLVLYFGVVTPMALLMRVFGYDPMKRKRDPETSTYWAERDRETDPTRYFSQY